MTRLFTELEELFNQNLLGRIKLRLFRQISGSPNQLPEDKQVRQFLIQQHQKNALFGKILTSILTLKTCYRADFAELLSVTDMGELLLVLEANPLHKPVFVEITNCQTDLPNSMGVWIDCTPLVDGGYVYQVCLVDEENFPNGMGYLEIRASQKHPEPMFSVLGPKGYEIYNLETHTRYHLINIVAQVLQFHQNHRPKTFLQLHELEDTEKSVDSTRLAPPLDPQCDRLITLALKNRTSCTQANVPLENIKPFDLDFCLAYPSDVIERSTEEIQTGSNPSLLVYWGGEEFVMSDDYAAYLAYRKLGYGTVPVVILGDFPESKANKLKVGGPELLPPIGVHYREDDYQSLHPKIKDWLLDKQLKEEKIAPLVSKLYGIFMRLSELVQDPNTKEHEIHDFLRAYPIILDPYGLYVMSEVKLGDKYRIDLVIQYNLNSKRILLIELERANIPIFTKTGRLRDKVTHASQQVEDWLRWWQENPTEVPKPLDSSVHPEGIVVIGRSAGMDYNGPRKLDTEKARNKQ